MTFASSLAGLLFAMVMPAQMGAVPSGGSGVLPVAWEAWEQKDSFTDQPILTTAEIINGRTHLSVTCNKGHFLTMVAVGSYLGSNTDLRFRYRIDDGAVVEGVGQGSTNGRTLFVSPPEEHAKRFMVGAAVFFEVTDFQGSVHRQRFTLSNAAATIAPIMKACGITP